MRRLAIVTAFACTLLSVGPGFGSPLLSVDERGIGGSPGLSEEVLSGLIENFRQDGIGAGLLNSAAAIGAGVERSAAGIEDNPLTAFIDTVDEARGPAAARALEGAANALISVLGPNLLADVDPIRLPPAFDIDNGRADVATVSLPSGPYILDIGNTHRIGDGEFARVVLGLVDRDGDDNDIEQILREIATGASGANLDFEQTPGISDVELLELSPEHFTLGFKEGGMSDISDRLTFDGPGPEAVLTRLDSEIGLLSVPEPGSALLLIGGVAGLIAGGRKRGRR